MQAQKQRITEVSARLYAASQTIRILAHINWSGDVRETFFANNCNSLPKVSYANFDPRLTLQLVGEARKLMADTDIDHWLERIAAKIQDSALMLAATGTADFYYYSERLYGKPTNPFIDGKTTPLELAKAFEQQIDSYASFDLGSPLPFCYFAEEIAGQMRGATLELFGDDAPMVEIVDELSANALASPKLIRIRKTASFSDLDARQLISHEAHIHVATSINGLKQPHLKILAAGHPGTTKTQEGLAVFSEFISGAIDLDRLQRLADRILAIQMSIEGADFLEVYDFFLTQTNHPKQAFENSRRVFRGGVLSGGAPFTKDGVYLEGFIRVNNILKVIATSGRADCLRLLFCGKLDIEDMPILYKLEKMGLCQPATYLPPWAKDARYLLAYLMCTSFLSKMDMQQVSLHYENLLAHIPKSNF